MAEEKNEVEAYIRKIMDEEKKKETAVGTVMKNGGGAVAGGSVGWYAGTAIGAALAPVTGGASLVLGPLLGMIGGGAVGHKMSKDID